MENKKRVFVIVIAVILLVTGAFVTSFLMLDMYEFISALGFRMVLTANPPSILKASYQTSRL